MFYRIMYLIVTLVFSHLGFWSGNLFLIASFPDLCLLVPFFVVCMIHVHVLSSIFIAILARLSRRHFKTGDFSFESVRPVPLILHI